MEEKKGHGIIKIKLTVLDRARALLAHLSQHGWSSIGVSRTDPPSLASLVDEGLSLLEARVKPARKR